MTYGDILTYTTYFLLKLWIYCNFAPRSYEKSVFYWK